MATRLFPRSTVADWCSGINDPNLIGTAVATWGNYYLTLTAGTAGTTTSTATVTGPTNGVEAAASTVPYQWITNPIDVDITISGAITFNIFALESASQANVAINARLEKIDGQTGAFTLIHQTVRATEVATSVAVNNFVETPAAGVLVKRGDRLRLRIFGDDGGGTMASGRTFGTAFDGASAGTSYTWIELTENVSFSAEPAGTTVYLTDTASDVTGALVEREASTSRGTGVQTDVTNTATGYVTPGTQVTDTAGGTAVEWYTRPLVAGTLGGTVRVNLMMLESAGAANVAPRCEIAIVNGDGSGAVVWGTCVHGAELATTEVVRSFRVCGPNTGFSTGQRFRIRFYNAAFSGSTGGAMASGNTTTLFYAGTSGGASGDTWLTFTQTFTEVPVVVRVPFYRPYTQLVAQ